MKLEQIHLYLKHLSCALNYLFTKFHHMPSNVIPTWQVKVCWGVVHVLKHANELRSFHFIKRLITGHNPFNKKTLKLCMIKSFLKLCQSC